MPMPQNITHAALKALGAIAASAAIIAALKALGVNIPFVRASISDLGWIAVACAAAAMALK